MGKGDDSRKVHVVCPTCRVRADVQVPTYIFQKNYNGIANIQIQPGDVCEHQFLISLDQDFHVRGVDRIDFQVKLAPQRTNVTELAFADILARFKSYATVGMLHAVIFNYPLQVVYAPLESDWLGSNLKALFKSILPPEWQDKPEITYIVRKEFENLQKPPEATFVVDTKGIVISTPWGKEKMYFEEELIGNANDVEDPAKQMDLLKKGVQDMSVFVQSAAEFVRKTEIVYDNDVQRFIDGHAPFKKNSGFILHLLKLFERRCPDGKTLSKKVRIKSLDVMTKTLWS